MIRWSCAAALVLLVVAGASARAKANDPAPLGEFVAAAQPVPAPAISVVDLAGNPVSLSEFAGKLVLLNLWATWCEPCLREMPSLERMQSRLADKITVVAIAEDRGGSKTVEPFLAKLGVKSFKTYLDPKSDVGRAFKVEGLPTSFLIDREGRVLGRVEGAAEWDSPKLLGVIRSFFDGDQVIKASLGKVRL